jgi:HPt (histidine-containing phosphotransfer) domain-containing protein
LRSLDTVPGRDSLGEVIRTYLATAPDQIEKLRDGLRRGDRVAVAKVAHALSSSSGNVGAAKLSARLKELERWAREDRGADANTPDPDGARRLTDVAEAFALACAALDALAARRVDASTGRHADAT